MFNLEDFQDYADLEPIVLRLDKFINKGKTAKASKVIVELEELLEKEDLLIPITYILSIIAEDYIELISQDLFNKVEELIQAENSKVKTNSITILGFFILKNFNLIEKYFKLFIDSLLESNEDVRENTLYFLQDFVKKEPKLIISYIDTILEAIKLEKKPENIISLLNFLSYINNLDFNQHYKFRKVAKTLVSSQIYYKYQNVSDILENVIRKFFPSLKNLDFKRKGAQNLRDLLDDQMIMKKHNFTEISKKRNIKMKEFISELKKSSLKDKRIYFYVKNNKKDLIYFYELEKSKLLEIFKIQGKISTDKLKLFFLPLIESEYELKLFIETLLKLGYIRGYFSKFYFYPYGYLLSEISQRFQKKGQLNIKRNLDYLPPRLIHEIVLELNQKFLIGKDNEIYYSLKKIKEQIVENAAKSSYIDLKPYREQLMAEDFLKLVKNLPKDYLTNYRKSTIWLTNIGKFRIETEINNSKLVGLLDLNKISKKLKINKILLMDVIELTLDERSGIWNKNKEVFYFSKYVMEKIDDINLISDEKEKNMQVESLANKLNIDKNHIITKIDENYQLIGQEIQRKDQIRISDYLEKLGMEYDVFISFINSLGLTYFKKGDLLIFSEAKIEDAKIDIKSMLINDSKSLSFITLGNFEITSTLIEDLIKELREEGKIKGLFYKEEDNVAFYTQKGIKELMLENSFLFSFEDLFYGKELSEDDIKILKDILDNLIKERKLIGIFEEDTLTFSSRDILFEFDYNKIVDDFGKIVNNHMKIFNFEYQKIKKILTKRDETIFPQEIKVIQDIIDKINLNYVKWRAQLNSFIFRANKKLLRDQGYTFKRYESLSIDKKKDIKLFKEDPDVYEYLNSFNQWVNVFNEIELKYGKIIFLQKRLNNNPNDEKSKNKLDDLLINLNLKN